MTFKLYINNQSVPMKARTRTLLLFLLFPTLLHGQEIGLLRMNPDSLFSKGNAAVWGGIEEGQFRPTYGADFQWSAGAETQVVRHGKHSSWMGALSFEQTMGQHMRSSMLLEPDYFPLDILETTQGMKSRQDVCLEAGFLADFGYEWAAGIKASAKGALVSKQQTLAHRDYGLDLQVEPALTYVMDDDMGLVSSYVVRLRTENLQVTEEIEGDGHTPFMDKGLLYGSYLPGNAFQILEFSHGFSELLHSPEFSAGLEIIWKRGQAQDGRFRFPGSTLSTFAEYTILADKADHVMRAAYKRQRDQLREPTEGGSFNSDWDRTGRNLELKYEARFLKGIMKSVAVVLDGNHWRERSLMPSTFQDQPKWFDGTASLLTSFSYGAVDLDLNFLAGRGWWQDRGLNGEPANGQLRLTDYWNWKMDYRMVPRTGMGGTLTCRIPGVKGLYAQLYAFWYHAFNVTYLPGQNREIGTLKIGYKF